jgi:hypothetical protein
MAIHGWFSFLVGMTLMLKTMAANHSGIVMHENELLMWVKWVGTLNHSRFDRAENHHRINLLTTIYVDHRRGFGHFNSVQAAIDHVPVNLDRRVHIIVAPGVYKYV